MSPSLGSASMGAGLGTDGIPGNRDGEPGTTPPTFFCALLEIWELLQQLWGWKHPQKTNNPALNFQFVVISVFVKDPHNYPCPAPSPHSQMGRGAEEGEHLAEINILQFLIKYEIPSGAGSRTILEYELSRTLHPRCPFFPPQPPALSSK